MQWLGLSQPNNPICSSCHYTHYGRGKIPRVSLASPSVKNRALGEDRHSAKKHVTRRFTPPTPLKLKKTKILPRVPSPAPRQAAWPLSVRLSVWSPAPGAGQGADKEEVGGGRRREEEEGEEEGEGEEKEKEGEEVPPSPRPVPLSASSSPRARPANAQGIRTVPFWLSAIAPFMC